MSRGPQPAGDDNLTSVSVPNTFASGSQIEGAKEKDDTVEVDHGQVYVDEDEEKQLGVFHKFNRFLLKYGIETHGITPIRPSQRVDKRIYQMFFIWFACNFNILAFGTGSAGPVYFGLGLWQSLTILAIVDVITCAVPAYFATFGPKLGMRSMVQARFSWGYYGAMLPSLLNVFSSQGFLILNCIIGGQALAAVSHKLDTTLGIVIIAVISLIVTFCGYRFLHFFESVAWVPSALAFPILLGLAGKHLDPSTFPTPSSPQSTASVLSFASLVTASVVSWCTFTPDYGVYHDANAPTVKIFSVVYLGFLIPSLAWHMLGAALACAAPGIPSWEEGYEGGNNVGGLLAAVLSPAGGFGKFMLVLIALGTSSACAPTMYTFGMSLMAVAPFFARIPRYVFAIISEAILIPLAIIGAKSFYSTLGNILGVIGYWSTAFASIILVEHFVFRRSRSMPTIETADSGIINSEKEGTSLEISTATKTYPFDYTPAQWNVPSRLPSGFAALLAFFTAFGIIIPSMSQTFYEGPIAAAGAGDIGVFVGGAMAVIVYPILRWAEKRVLGR